LRFVPNEDLEAEGYEQCKEIFGGPVNAEKQR
jgi:hypothetical protein